MKMMITGHRPQKLGGFRNFKLFVKIKEEIRKVMSEQNPDIFISGMALLSDQLGAEVAIDLHIPFIAAIPCEGQELRWPSQAIQHYQWLLSKADSVVYVDRELGYISNKVPPGVYHRSKMMTRNQWMVDQLGKDGEAIAVYGSFKEAEKGGTAHTVSRLDAAGIVIHCIDPVKLGFQQ